MKLLNYNVIDTIIWYNNLGNLSNANHKFLKTAIICQPHVSSLAIYLATQITFSVKAYT